MDTAIYRIYYEVIKYIDVVMYMYIYICVFMYLYAYIGMQSQRYRQFLRENMQLFLLLYLLRFQCHPLLNANDCCRFRPQDYRLGRFLDDDDGASMFSI